MKSDYRGRIAPTPTGYLHLGHARTFWIAQQRAQEAGGNLIYRCEDLDPDRCKPEFAQAAIDDLHWFGCSWSEGPDVGGDHGPEEVCKGVGLALQRGHARPADVVLVGPEAVIRKVAAARQLPADLTIVDAPDELTASDSPIDAMRKKLTESLKRVFRPEFINRVDSVIVFRSLSQEHIKEIVSLELAKVSERLQENEITLVPNEEAIELLAELGYSEEAIASMAKENLILCHPPPDGQQPRANPWGL